MATEATNVPRMKNRRRVIMVIIPGAISQRGIKRTPDAAAIHIAIKTSRKNNAGFLEKQKPELTSKERG